MDLLHLPVLLFDLFHIVGQLYVQEFERKRGLGHYFAGRKASQFYLQNIERN